MTIEALVTLKLLAAPEQRTSASGTTYAKARGRVIGLPPGERDHPDAAYVNVTAFGERARAALMAVESGGTIAATGALQLRSYTDKEGKPRLGLELVAAAVLTTYQCAKRKAAARGDQEPPKPPPAPPAAPAPAPTGPLEAWADDIPF